MKENEALKLISEWEKDSFYSFNEDDSVVLNIYLPLERIEQIKDFLDKDDSNLDDFISDAEYAYMVLNNVSEDIFTPSLTFVGAKKLAGSLSKTNPFKEAPGFYKVPIVLNVEEMDALNSLLNLNRNIKENYSINDLFIDFIDAYSRIDKKLLDKLMDETLEEINEDFRNKKA